MLGKQLYRRSHQKKPGGAVEKYGALYKTLIGDAHQSLQIEIYSESLDENHVVQSLIHKFGMYPLNKIVFRYEKFQPFLLTTLKEGKRGKETEYNLANLKELTPIKIQDNKLYVNNIESILFDTASLEKQNKSFCVTWIMNKRDELFAGAFCHAYFLKSKVGRPFYGYAKPVTCSGNIRVKEDKIRCI